MNLEDIIKENKNIIKEVPKGTSFGHNKKCDIFFKKFKMPKLFFLETGAIALIFIQTNIDFLKKKLNEIYPDFIINKVDDYHLEIFISGEEVVIFINSTYIGLISRRKCNHNIQNTYLLYEEILKWKN